MTAQKMYLMKPLAVLGVIVALVSACGATGVAPAQGPPPVTVRWADRDLVGRWTDAAGRELPDGTAASNGILVLQASVGSTTCSRDDVTIFLQLSWPVGRQVDWSSGNWTDDDAPVFIRDTSGGGIRTFKPSDLDTELPATARPTGFRREGNQLSVGPEPDAVYVTRPDGHTERWSRMRPGEGCA